MALKHRKPHLHIDLSETGESDAVRAVHQWIAENRIATLNVAGPRASEDSLIYQSAVRLLEELLPFSFHARNQRKRRL